jgi:hypothetical protein
MNAITPPNDLRKIVHTMGQLLQKRPKWFRKLRSFLRTSVWGATRVWLVPCGAATSSSSLRSPSAAPAAACASTGGGASSPSLVLGFVPQFPIAPAGLVACAIDGAEDKEKGWGKFEMLRRRSSGEECECDTDEAGDPVYI